MRNYMLEKLQRGETVIRNKEPGNSMTPIIKSRQPVDIEPVTEDTILKVDDIVYCKVKGNFYTHKITAVKDDQYQISNNHKHINGWIGKSQIYGKIIKIWAN